MGDGEELMRSEVEKNLWLFLARSWLELPVAPELESGAPTGFTPEHNILQQYPRQKWSTRYISKWLKEIQDKEAIDIGEKRV